MARKPPDTNQHQRPQRAALYLRQSLDVQEGMDRQRGRCTMLAEAKGWDVVESYEDNDTSATKARADGTAWSRLIADASAGKFDIIIAVDLDRLLRSIQDLATLINTGAKVLTVDGEIDLTTADGEFRATMLAAIARFETRRKGERQKRATKHAAAQGRRTSGRRPFGYEPDGVTVRPNEAEAVVDGYASFLAGVSLGGIARAWNAAGLVTGQNRTGDKHRGEPSPWTPGSVRTVLANPRYMGKRAHLGEIVADALWPALVDAETWEAVDAILRNPLRRSAPKRGRYLLSGLAVCGVCGAKVHAGGNARKGVPAYRCGGSSGHFARRAIPVEEFVEAVIVSRLSRQDAIELLTDQKFADITALRAESVGLRERMETLAIEFADGALTAAQIRTATERLRSRLGAVEDKIADAARVDVLGALVGSQDIQATWADLDQSRKRAVISVLATVSLHPVGRGVRKFDPETVGIEWLS